MTTENADRYAAIWKGIIILIGVLISLIAIAHGLSALTNIEIMNASFGTGVFETIIASLRLLSKILSTIVTILLLLTIPSFR